MLLYIEHENETAIFNSTNVYNLLQYTAVTSSSGIKYLKQPFNENSIFSCKYNWYNNFLWHPQNAVHRS